MGTTTEWLWGGKDSPLERAVTRVRTKTRLQLPPGSREILGDVALALMTEDGRIRLVNWEPRGPQLEKDFETARAALASDNEAIEDLLDIANRHDRLNVDAGGRLTMNVLTMAHLDVVMGTRKRPSSVRARTVFVWKIPGAVEIWSRRYRNRRLVAPEGDD